MIKRLAVEGPNYQLIDVPTGDTIAYVNWLNINGERQFALSGELELAKGYQNDKLTLNLRGQEGNTFESHPYRAGAQVHL